MLDTPVTTGGPLTPRSEARSGTRLPRAAAAALAASSGVVLSLAFPPYGWWPLAPVAVAGLALATRSRSAGFAALLGALTGLGFFLPHLHWSGVYVGVLPWAALSVLQTLFFALMAMLLPGVWRLSTHVRARAGETSGALVLGLGVSGLWVAQEALRGRVPFGGFPWGRAAFSQADSPLAVLAWLGGAPLVTAAVALLGAALTALVAGPAEPAEPSAKPTDGPGGRVVRRLYPALVLAVPAVVLVATAAALRADGPQATGTVRVAAVQGNVPEAGLEFNAERRAVLDNHAQGTIALAERVAADLAEQPDLVFWPENASDIDPLRNPDAAAVITGAAEAIGVPILVGTVLREPVNRLSNAGIVWGPPGSEHAGPGVRYVKKHPAPFAEYIPYRALFRRVSDKVDLVRTDFAPGRLSGALPMGDTTVGDVICFEVAYDGIVQRVVRDGARLLVVQTNNATFGYTDESVQQLAMSRLRAIETGRSVVHISTVGVSALYGPDGAELARSGHFTAEVLEARVPLHDDLTPAVRFGLAVETVLAFAGLFIAVGGFVVTGRSRRKAVGSTSAPE